MTIDDLKRALVEVKRICEAKTNCNSCPFDDEYLWFCPLHELPCNWHIDDWKEDGKDA